MNKLPLYKASINVFDDEYFTGIYTISLVDMPAVDSDFVAFGKPNEVKMRVENEEKRIITGVVMRCDYPIYRNDGGYEYYVTFDADTIKQITQKWFKTGLNTNVNIMHTCEYVSGVDMQQAFIKDTEKGLNPVGFEDIADGSLFVTYKVNNDEVWQAIKKGEFKGFSLEGYLNYDKVESDEDKLIDEISEIIKQIANK